MMFISNRTYAVPFEEFLNRQLYQYVSSTFLNGFVNYLKPVKAYLLERYITQGPKYEEEVWKKFLQGSFHTRLKDLEDDVLLLAESPRFWWFLWFDCDVSDCQIGRCDKAQLNKEEVIAWFDLHVKTIQEPEDSSAREERKGLDYDTELGWECITGYREISVNLFKGWIKF